MTEFVRWVQSSLNLVSDLRLRLNGVMSRGTRDALRGFQEREGLIVDGIAGPETEQALVDARATRARGTETEAMELEGLEYLDLADVGLEEEVDRNSREYIRWVQGSLNDAMGLRLAVVTVYPPS